MMPMELSFAGALLVARLRSFLQLNVVAFVNERDFPHSVAHVTLILKTTRSQYGSPFDAENDYVVLHDGRVIGRIFLSPQAPQGCSWFWTITAREHPASIHSRGYSATREQAMADFKAQWLAQPT